MSADPFSCAVCGRTIGRTAVHRALGPGLVAADRMICLHHMDTAGDFHAKFWPDCPTWWHDMYDHPCLSGTRAGMRAAAVQGYVIQAWPERDR